MGNKENVSINSMVLLKNCRGKSIYLLFNFIDRTRTILLFRSLCRSIFMIFICVYQSITGCTFWGFFLWSIFIYCSESLAHYYSKKGTNFACCCHNPFYLMVEWYNVYLANSIHYKKDRAQKKCEICSNCTPLTS